MAVTTPGPNGPGMSTNARVSRCGAKTYLAFSAQITDTQRLLRTLAMVAFFFAGYPIPANAFRQQTPVNTLFQLRISLPMERGNYKV